MTFSSHLLSPQSSGQAQRTGAADAAQAQAQAKAELTQAQAEMLRAQVEMRRVEIEARRAGLNADAAEARARFSTGIAPSFIANGGMSRRQESMMFVGFVVVVIAGAVILSTFARALGRRFDRSRQNMQLDADTTAQLQRIEHAVDAMAVEIERLSEGQRFTTKLLAQRAESESMIKRG